jgi:hypothetical protein
MAALAVTGCGERMITFESSSERPRDNEYAPSERERDTIGVFNDSTDCFENPNLSSAAT